MYFFRSWYMLVKKRLEYFQLAQEEFFLKNVRVGLILALILLFGLGAADGISQVRGMAFLPPLLENVLTGLFFLAAAGLMVIAWKAKDRAAMGRLRTWSGLVLGISVGMLFVLWGLVLASPSPQVMNAVICVLAIVSTPMTCCTVMFIPVLGWSLTFVVSWYLTRKIPRQFVELKD